MKEPMTFEECFKDKLPGNSIPSNKVEGYFILLEELTQRSKGDVIIWSSSRHQPIAMCIAFEKNGLKRFIFHSNIECTQFIHMRKQGHVSAQRIIKGH